MRTILIGDVELRNKLANMRLVETKKAFRKGARQAAKRVLASVKGIIPVRSGALARSLKVRALPRSRKYIGVQVTSSQYYVSFTDLGTRYQKAQKFMQKAFKQERQSSLDTITEALKGAVERR